MRHSLRVEGLLGPESVPVLLELERVRALLLRLAALAGPGQTTYDPQVAKLRSPEGGLSGVCLFPGGSVVIHTFEPAGRLPARVLLDVTASDPLRPAELVRAVELELGVLVPPWEAPAVELEQPSSARELGS